MAQPAAATEELAESDPELQARIRFQAGHYAQFWATAAAMFTAEAIGLGVNMWPEVGRI